MFRRLFASIPNYPKTFTGTAGAGVSLAAAAIAITDAELKKKPSWYQETVHRLESTLNKLSIYSYIENTDVLHEAKDILQRTENVNNCELSWRLGRAYTELAESCQTNNRSQREKYLNVAIEHFKKALTLEPSKGCAGLHKWYAIALKRMKHANGKNPAVKNFDKEFVEHMGKALNIDPKDAIAHHLFGVYQYEKGRYNDAMKNFTEAENLKKEFFPANLYYIGITLMKLGKKDDAVPVLKKTLATSAKSKFDRKAKGEARSILVLQFKKSPEELAAHPEY